MECQKRLYSLEKLKEKAKSDRISQQNTEQSKLINQRKNNLPPQVFESNEDSLDGFDLAEFSPDNMAKKRTNRKGNKICPAGKAWAMKTYKRWSAYAAMGASKYCKDPNYARLKNKYHG